MPPDDEGGAPHLPVVMPLTVDFVYTALSAQATWLGVGLGWLGLGLGLVSRSS